MSLKVSDLRFSRFVAPPPLHVINDQSLIYMYEDVGGLWGNYGFSGMPYV